MPLADIAFWACCIMIYFFKKNAFLILVVAFCLVVVWGFAISPPFFIFEGALAATFQPSVFITLCGNGVLDGGETCDDGANNGRYAYNANDKFCNTTCTGWAAYCGDGTKQTGYGETCDDGNNIADDGCSATCQTEPAPPPSGGGGIFLPPVETRLVFEGKAYPGSKVIILKDGKGVAIAEADSRADFTQVITDINPGIYTFGLWAKDQDGRKSITYSLTFRVLSNAITTVRGIFLPPTIDLSETQLQKGDILNIFGQTVPEVEVEVHINSDEIIKKTESDEIGTWLVPVDTQVLEEGLHTARARYQISSEEISGFGNSLAFSVGKVRLPVPSLRDVCLNADFNEDGRVNLTDFSIFLCWWARSSSQHDLNQNGVVDLPDFSILLCCWTG